MSAEMFYITCQWSLPEPILSFFFALVVGDSGCGNHAFAGFTFLTISACLQQIFVAFLSCFDGLLLTSIPSSILHLRFFTALVEVVQLQAYQSRSKTEGQRN